MIIRVAVGVVEKVVVKAKIIDIIVIVRVNCILKPH